MMVGIMMVMCRDAGDSDDDNDGAADDVDSEDNNHLYVQMMMVIHDDCTSGTHSTSNDGWDYDSDGACDAGDTMMITMEHWMM